MTELQSPQNATQNRADCYSSIFSLSAVFIAFAILATLLCATLPAFQDFISLPINESALSYTYTDISTLLSDSFTHAAEHIGLMFAFFLCAFSLFCEAVISSVSAINGFCCGCVLFYSLLRGNDARSIFIYLFFYVFGCVLVVIFASFCISSHRIMFSQQRTTRLRTAAKLIFAFLSFGGAFCLLKLIELTLL